MDFTRHNFALSDDNPLNQRMKQFEQEIINERTNHKILMEKIDKLEKNVSIIINDNQNLKKINERKDLIDDLISKLKNVNNELLSFNTNLSKKDRVNLLEELRVKGKIISSFPVQVKEGEKLLSVIFESLDQKIHYSCICKNTDKFNTIENMLYKKYPEYLSSENKFSVNGNAINKYQTLEFNKIENSDIIMLNNAKETLN